MPGCRPRKRQSDRASTSRDRTVQIPTLIAQIQVAVPQMDSALQPGLHPATSEAVESVVLLAARVHGEWVWLNPLPTAMGGPQILGEFYRATLSVPCVGAPQCIRHWWS